MGRAVSVRADYTAGEVRRLAKRAKDAAQARRLLAIAAVIDGASRTEAAKLAGWFAAGIGVVIWKVRNVGRVMPAPVRWM
jgi:hypothetical protein